MKIRSLDNLPDEPNTHNPKITKKVLIKKGIVPKLTNFTQAIFPPGEIAPGHSHQDMFEIFFIEKGQGKIKINGMLHDLKEGDCVVVELEEVHELINSGAEELLVTYLGVEIA